MIKDYRARPTIEDLAQEKRWEVLGDIQFEQYFKGEKGQAFAFTIGVHLRYLQDLVVT